MNGAEFLKRLKRLGKELGTAVWFDPVKGHGSHGMVFFGDKCTVLKDRKKEIGPGLLASMLRDLGVNKGDF